MPLMSFEEIFFGFLITLGGAWGVGRECVYDSLFTEVNQNDQAHRVIHDLRTRGRT